MRWLLVAAWLFTAVAPRGALADEGAACCGPADLACAMALAKKDGARQAPSHPPSRSMLLATVKRGLALELGAWMARVTSPLDPR